MYQIQERLCQPISVLIILGLLKKRVKSAPGCQSPMLLGSESGCRLMVRACLVGSLRPDKMARNARSSSLDAQVPNGIKLAKSGLITREYPYNSRADKETAFYILGLSLEVQAAGC